MHCGLHPCVHDCPNGAPPPRPQDWGPLLNCKANPEATLVTLTMNWIAAMPELDQTCERAVQLHRPPRSLPPPLQPHPAWPPCSGSSCSVPLPCRCCCGPLRADGVPRPRVKQVMRQGIESMLPEMDALGLMDKGGHAASAACAAAATGRGAPAARRGGAAERPPDAMLGKFSSVESQSIDRGRALTDYSPAVQRWAG